MKISELIRTLEDEEWLLSKLPSKVKTCTLLFSTKKNGFNRNDWSNTGIGKKCTLTIVKSSANRIFGGYLHIQWEKGSIFGTYRENPNGFIFSLSNKQVLFPTNKEKAIHFDSDGSLGFGSDSIGFCNDPLNKKDGCSCFTNGKGGYNYFNVPNDKDGNNLLTGEGSGKRDEEKMFTIALLETYMIEYS